jgi:hypothetical protein
MDVPRSLPPFNRKKYFKAKRFLRILLILPIYNNVVLGLGDIQQVGRLNSFELSSIFLDQRPIEQ